MSSRFGSRSLGAFCALVSLPFLLPAAAQAGLDRPCDRPARAVIAAALPAVVSISGQRAGADALGGHDVQGAGFVIDADGLIVTNAHITDGVADLAVELLDGRRLPVRLVGADLRVDIAVLRLATPAALPSLGFAPAGSVQVGDSVFAIGDPLGDKRSVSAGIVSGLDRAYDPAAPVGFLQHDAAINPGSSGGPLIDACGRVAGINTALPDGQRSFAGVAYALPADRVAGLVTRLAKGETIERGSIGATLRPVAGALARGLGLAPGAGALVDALAATGPAAGAGLQASDLIVAVDGARVASPHDVVVALGDRRPGETVALTVRRADGEQRLTLTLGPDRASHFGQDTTSAKAPADWRKPGLAVQLVERQLVVNKVEAASPAGQAGLRAGDRVLAVGRIPVATPAALQAALDKASGDALVLLVGTAEGGTRHVVLTRTPGGDGQPLHGNRLAPGSVAM